MSRGTPTLTVAQATRLGLRYEQPARAPDELVACFVRGRLVNGKNQSRGWQLKAWGRYKREWKERTADAFLMTAGADRMWGRVPQIDPRAPKLVTFHAIVPSAMDSDGLALACAPIRDALKTAAIIDDDRDSAGHVFEYTQEAKRKGVVHGVVVRVRARS